MAQKDRFWNRHATGYAKRPVADEETYQRKLKETREFLEPYMTVLEFGCGTGTTALYHADRVKHIRAIDISAKMLEIANQKATASGTTNVTFEQSDIETLSVLDASFDIIMGHSILHLLEDKEAAISKVYNILKPGGYFISSTACLSGAAGFWKLILPIGYKLGLLPMVKFLKREELETCLTNAGFEMIRSWQPSPSQGVFIIMQKPA